MRRGFEATGDGVPLWEKFDGPVFAIFGELDSSHPSSASCPDSGGGARALKEDLLRDQGISQSQSQYPASSDGQRQ